ncbi:4-(cytidine 5'-diphospho)-2-C-methyl-D-erythritol kinase, partial [Mycobacterium tuberculosis]|nr:4-(cytidine 5'-diphospho)-2-C-methyl-D-erythritol kinase [Mycobacterium tuberculosis]
MRGALAGIVSGSGPTCAFLCTSAIAAAAATFTAWRSTPAPVRGALAGIVSGSGPT